MSELAERYGTKEIETALRQLEARREYQRKYFKSDRGRLAQRRSQVRSILSRSGTFTEEEITAIVARVRLPEDDGDHAKGGGVE